MDSPETITEYFSIQSMCLHSSPLLDPSTTNGAWSDATLVREHGVATGAYSG